MNKNKSHLAWQASLIFGFASGLELILGYIIGLDRFSEGDILFIILSVLLEILVMGGATGIFWRMTPRREEKWRFMIPLAAVTLLDLFLNLFILTGVGSGLTFWFVWFGVEIGFGLIRAMLWGLVFGGCFGWVYQGRKGFFGFAMAGVTGKVLGFLVGQASFIPIYKILSIQEVPSLYINSHPWFAFLMMATTILGGLIFGAILGRKTDRAHPEVDAV
jgi:hypothetical protein